MQDDAVAGVDAQLFVRQSQFAGIEERRGQRQGVGLLVDTMRRFGFVNDEKGIDTLGQDEIRLHERRRQGKKGRAE